MICEFKKLSKDNINKIVNKKIKEIKNNFLKNDIKISVSKKVIEEIIEKSEYNIYGARRLNKLLEDKIDNVVIDNILMNKNRVYIN